MNSKRLFLPFSIMLTLLASATGVAQAEVVLTDAEGTQLQAGAKVTVITTDTEMTVGEDGIVCESVAQHLELTDAGPGHLELEPLGQGSAEGCGTTSGLDITTTDYTVAESLTIDTWGTGEAATTFISDTFFEEMLVSVCHFSGTLQLEATHETDTLHFLGTLEGVTLGGLPCFKEGEMHGSYTLQTSDGEPVLVDFEATG